MGSKSTNRVAAALAEQGLELTVQTYPASTRTAEDAAAAIGCGVAQIAKSLVFRGAETDQPILIIAAGNNRVDMGKVATLVGETPARADADYVRAMTGFAIGGVAPVGHLTAPRIILDTTLQDHAVIWAAAGAPNAVFSITPAQLATLTGAPWADIHQG